MRRPGWTFAAMALAGALSACASVPGASRLDTDTGMAAAETPRAAWDHLPRGEVWTDAAMTALDGPAAALVETVPEDVERWCPAYPDADESARKAFWVGLISSLAGHESTWRPQAAGGDGKWHGLLQISPATARSYGCRAKTSGQLQTGAANLACGLRIMARTVTRDEVVAADGGGVAADWGPFSQPRKREAMRAFTSSQPYCQA